MSMKVDYTTPLTDEERAYLEARGSYADIERADALNGVETPPAGEGDGTGPQMRPLLTSEDRATEAARLRARLAEIEGTDSPDADDTGDELAEAPYEEWTVNELKAEIDGRNAEDGRPHDRKLSKAGSQADLAARLRKDDEDQAAQQA